MLVGAAVAAIGLACRLWLVHAYPTIPVSDFRRIVEFALALASQGPVARSWHWSMVSPGAPMLLALPLRLIHADPALVARTCTALMLGLLPLLALAMLRRALPAWACAVAVTLLALQPASLLFSGVVAQDNWVQLPLLALGCLAIRNVHGPGRGVPAWAALLWVLATYVRGEMLLVAAPLAFVAAWPWHDRSRRGPAMAGFLALALALLAAVALQRQAATGRFALTTEHDGTTVLGSYIPGAGFGWQPPESFAASVDPQLATDPARLRAGAGPLALAEIRQRPLFHAQRRLGATLSAATASDGTLAWWSLQGEAQTGVQAAGAAALADASAPWLRAALVLLHALFAGALWVAVRTRDRALLALAACVALKFAVHLLLVSQARFFLAVAPVEALAVALAAARLARTLGLGRGAATVAAGALLVLSAGVAALPRWQNYVERADPPVPQRYALLLGDYGWTRCVVTQGEIGAISATSAELRMARVDPAPGERAELRCGLRRTRPGAVWLEVEDAYAPGGFPDRIFQVVQVDGVERRRHDIAAEPWAGWWRRRLPDADAVEFVVVLQALRPDPGPGWGNAAATRVRLVERRAAGEETW